MSSTLVAVFDDYSEAQDASRKLQAAGIDKQSIQLNGADSGAEQMSVGTASSDEPGTISRFFSSIFGMDDDRDASKYTEAARRGSIILTVSVADEARVDDISDLLDDCGAIDVDERAQQWQATDAAPASGKAMLTGGVVGASAATSAAEGDTLKVVEETMKVGTRTVQKGNVRVHRRVVETPVEEQVSLRDERASIERVKVDRPATEADLQSAFQDKSIDIQETTQEAVVSKAARVVEEVKVGKKATEHTDTVRETLRHTEIDVDKNDDAATSPRMGGARSALMAYSGAERRVRNDPGYRGAERRASI